MFERFTERARHTVLRAQEESARAGHGHIGTEHLLLGLLAGADGVAGQVLRQAGLHLDEVRDAVVRVLGPAPPGTDDAAVLRSIGIDLDQVRASVEATFGPGALAAGRRCRAGRWRPRRRGGGSGVPFTPRAKKALERALREALRLRHSHVGTEHLLLGLLADGDGRAARLLVDRGVAPVALRSRVLAALGQVA